MSGILDRSWDVPCVWVGPQAPWARERMLLAPYATFSDRSAGRRHAEQPPNLAGPFAVDRDRLIRSAAYRRLSAKTQVFTGSLGDYHRTRLTHTLEVSSVARTLGRALGLNEDLIEALALAHDLGHPPFGHAGEATLDECLASEGGFSHNRHALVLLETLEQCDPAFPGLNLSAEVLSGQAARADRALASRGVALEVQVVEAADSVAYDGHDADDALELGLLEIGELLELGLWGQAARRVRGRYAALDHRSLRRAVLAELTRWQIDDLLAQTQRQIAERQIRDLADVLAAGTLVLPTAELAEQKAQLERFLYQRVYRHPQVLAMRQQAQEQLRRLFERLMADPERMSPRYRRRIQPAGTARAVGEYLAGMTDRYAVAQFQSLVGGQG